MAVGTASHGILSTDKSAERERIITMLKKAYWMEIETVMSYIANSTNPDGVRAQEIREALAEDIGEELGHAQMFAQRIKELVSTETFARHAATVQEGIRTEDGTGTAVEILQGIVDEAARRR